MASIYLDDIIKGLDPEQKPPVSAVPAAPPAPAADKPPYQAQEPPNPQADPPEPPESKGFPEFSDEFIKAFGE